MSCYSFGAYTFPEYVFCYQKAEFNFEKEIRQPTGTDWTVRGQTCLWCPWSKTSVFPALLCTSFSCSWILPFCHFFSLISVGHQESPWCPRWPAVFSECLRAALQTHSVSAAVHVSFARGVCVRSYWPARCSASWRLHCVSLSCCSSSRLCWTGSV